MYVSAVPSLILWVEKGVMPGPGEFADQREGWALAAERLYLAQRAAMAAGVRKVRK